MVNDMFQTELTDEEMQQVTGGVPAPTYGGGVSGAGYVDPTTGYTVASVGAVSGPGTTGSAIGFNYYTGVPNSAFSTTNPGGTTPFPYFY